MSLNTNEAVAQRNKARAELDRLPHARSCAIYYPLLRRCDCWKKHMQAALYWVEEREGES